jgi:non-specific serine/threonine protein kinase
VIERLVGYFGGRRVLLIMDNCEHLIDACAGLVRSLLLSCAALQVIATSRELLGVEGELAYRVPSLELPSVEDLADPEKLRGIASIRLFAERARARSRESTLTTENVRHVAEICVRLDGIPLAIELAAARVGALPLPAIEQRLTDRFALLSSGLRSGVPRHQTLHAMIDWSYELLTEAERVLLRHLSVFAGGWTLVAAEKIAGTGMLRSNDVLGLLPGLVDKSLVVLDASNGRYHMLEMVREYALERLRESSDEASLRDRHLDYFIAAAEEMYLAAHHSEVEEVQLAPDQENVLAALHWCETGEGGAQKGLQLIGAARLLFTLLDQAMLGYQLLQRLLRLPGANNRTAARGRALVALAEAGVYLGYDAEAWAAGQEGLSIAREIADRRMEAQLLRSLGSAAFNLGKRKEAAECFEEAVRLSKEVGLPRLLALALNDHAEVLRADGDVAGAGLLYRQAVAIQRNIGANHDLAVGLANLSFVEVLTGDLSAAHAHVSELLDLTDVPYGYTWVEAVLTACWGYLIAVGDHLHAACLLGAVEKRWQDLNTGLDRADDLFLATMTERACSAVGETAWQAALAEGRQLSVQEAVRAARKWLAASK